VSGMRPEIRRSAALPLVVVGGAGSLSPAGRVPGMLGRPLPAAGPVAARGGCRFGAAFTRHRLPHRNPSVATRRNSCSGNFVNGAIHATVRPCTSWPS